MAPHVRPEDFTLTFSNEFNPYPFFEDEGGYITGYGHQDKKSFANEVSRYDLETGEDYGTVVEEYLPHVRHRWGAYDPTGEYIIPPSHEILGETFPITTLWGCR